jgi:ABC-type glycerol-3-phosphate transport system substrate-binding protein
MKWGGQAMAVPLGVDPTALGPIADAGPAISLLTLAASKAMSNDRIGVLFDTETMKPRITEPAFVEALTQLAAGDGESKSARPNDEPRIPVLGYGDRIAAVTSTSHNAASAFKLLEWLAQADTSSQLARAGVLRLPTRRSLASAAAWHDPVLGARERAERGKALSASLSGERSLAVPRIPAIDEYLAALDDAVNAVVQEKTTARDALQIATDRWEEITDAHGRDKQRDAYQKHLGIE